MLVVSYGVVSGKLFQTCLIFVNKAGAYPKVLHSRRRLLAIPTNIRPSWKGLPRINTLAYYKHS
jgi:hypothetical protein